MDRSATGTVNTMVIVTIAVSVIRVVMIMMMGGGDDDNDDDYNIITTYFTGEITFHVAHIVNTEQLHHCIP